MWPIRLPFHRGATLMPSVMAPGEPASTAWSNGVDAPSSRMNANANGRSSGCCSVGSGTQVHDWIVPAGPTSTSSRAQFGPGRRIPFHRRTSTPSPLRIPRILFSVSAVMNAPITGPSDRLYGNVMLLSSNLTTATSSLDVVDPCTVVSLPKPLSVIASVARFICCRSRSLVDWALPVRSRTAAVTHWRSGSPGSPVRRARRRRPFDHRIDQPRDQLGDLIEVVRVGRFVERGHGPLDQPAGEQ